MRLIGVFLALVLATLAGFLVLKFMDKPEEATPQELVAQPRQPDIQTVEVLVAARPIPLGDVIESNMVESQPWPSHLVLDGFIVRGADSKEILKMIARSSFQIGEPIIMSKLGNPNDPGFLAAALPGGMRIATISTDAIAGLAGFVFPGDRVDVLVTHPIPKENLKESDKDNEETVTETLLTNVRVMAVDQRSEGGMPDKLKPPANVSLEVAPDDAQRLRLAQETGYLSLTLRSIEDKETIDSTGITHVRNLSQTDTYGRSGSVLIVRGTEVTEARVNMTTIPESTTGNTAEVE